MKTLNVSILGIPIQSISSGMPLLEAEAIKEGKVAMEELARCFTRSQSLLPSA